MLIPVILSGGIGARLWPVSREAHPKPFMKLPDGQSLIQKTFQRVADFSDVAEIVTVTNRDYYFQALDEFCAMPISQTTRLEFLLEPCGRNTAPAIALAAQYVAEKYGHEANLLVMPADHLIERQETFAQAVDVASQLAEQGKLVTFGLQPDRPETGYGYIEKGESFAGLTTTEGLTVCSVKNFVEKPSRKTAEHYLACGNFLWNAGIFCFSAGAFLDALEQTSPDVFEAVSHCWQQVTRTAGQIHIPQSIFTEVPDISVDYAVMEKAENVAVIGCDLGWSDVGSWSSLGDLTPADDQGNRIVGRGLAFASRNCTIHSENRLVTTLGVENLVVVDTPDALLVADKDKVQDVKQIVQKLKAEGHPAYRTHNTVHRPWGTYTEIERGDRFKIKRIVVKPGASLSLQMHHHRSEHWVVVNGTARVVNGTKDNLLSINESTYIPIGEKHRLENPGKVPLVLIEVQSGEYLEEDDIVRFDDIYGRN